MKKFIVFLIFIVVVAGAVFVGFTGLYHSFLPHNLASTIPRLEIGVDKNGNGIDDLADIVTGARQEIWDHPIYRSNYYEGGYPPYNEGVCTDVIWRAFEYAGYDLKKLIDQDIKLHRQNYPRVIENEDRRPDPNIDFRRVPNQAAFFLNNAEVLTTDVFPGNIQNMTEWQGGDIVVFGEDFKHIGIVSDIRNSDSVPFVIHNSGPIPQEADLLTDPTMEISGHYRYPKVTR